MITDESITAEAVRKNRYTLEEFGVNFLYYEKKQT